ncbi:hypothetical protein T265_15792, partial [Opisthorchis viverrini]
TVFLEGQKTKQFLHLINREFIADGRLDQQWKLQSEGSLQKLNKFNCMELLYGLHTVKTLREIQGILI